MCTHLQLNDLSDTGMGAAGWTVGDKVNYSELKFSGEGFCEPDVCGDMSGHENAILPDHQHFNMLNVDGVGSGPAAPTANTASNLDTVRGYTWAKQPGVFAWIIHDGLPPPPSGAAELESVTTNNASTANVGDTRTITVTYSRAVTVSGNLSTDTVPKLQLSNGGEAKCNPVNSSTEVECEYEVGPADSNGATRVVSMSLHGATSIKSEDGMIAVTDPICSSDLFSVATTCTVAGGCSPCTLPPVPHSDHEHDQYVPFGEAGINVTCEEGYESSGPSVCGGSGTLSPAVVCTACATMKYYASADAGCTYCGPNEYTNAVGQTSCKSCPAGRVVTQGPSVVPFCAPCGAGKFKGPDHTCHSCAAGKFQRQEGQTSCITCPSGKFQSETEGTACHVWSTCFKGKYVQADGTTYIDKDCQDCASGTYSGGDDQTSCDACGTGTFSHPGAQSCTECGVGTYSDEFGAADSCPHCPAGKANQNSSEGPSKETCFFCEEGTHADGSGLSTLACAACLKGRYQTQEGQATCAQCPTGEYMNEMGKTGCKTCDPGTVPSTNGHACEDCAEGKYQDQSGQATCDECAPGHYADVKKRTSCMPCAKGSMMTDHGAHACAPCMAGQYGDDTGQTACQSCATGTSASGEGNETCAPCAAGRAQELVGQENCTDCSAGRFAASTGLTECNECEVNTYQDVPGQDSCKPCPVRAQRVLFASVYARTPHDSFRLHDRVNQLIIHNCLPSSSAQSDKSTEGLDGQTTCDFTVDVCVDGQYVTVHGADTVPDQCADCAKGTASSSANDEGSCPSCTSGKYQAETGQASCDYCPGGHYPFGSYETVARAVTCLPCDVGHYRPATADWNQCEPCAGGHFAPTTSGSSGGCEACPPGQHSNADNTGCDDCAVGKVSPDFGAASCIDCEVGKYAPVQNLDECLDCSVETYQDQEGAAQCRHCVAGRYNDNAVECTDCVPGRFTGCSDGVSLTHEECTGAGNDWFGTSPTTDCHICDVGEFAGEAATVCTDCAVGTFGEHREAEVCQDCPSGSVATEVGLTFCTECTIGTSSAADRSSCVDCAAGKFASEAR